jgi:beta-barrel assembly-enhancing protease
MLGRWDEGVEELVAGSRLRENRQANVSQVIELANLYCELGRPAEAIPILDKAGANISGYGAMQKESVRLWAALQLGDNKQSALSLKFLSEHRSDAPGTYFDALIIANKPAEAERFMVARLRDPDLRQEALGEVQVYALPPLPPLAMSFETARRSVIDRDSVQAQIRKVGRVETYHLESP